MIPALRERFLRRLAGALVIASLGLAGLPASAQIIGIPQLDRMPRFRYDWNVEQHELTNVIERDIKKAYREGIRNLQDGNCRDAHSKFEFILDFIDDDPLIYYVAATSARCMRGFRAAAGYYESAIEFEPAYYEAHRFLGLSRLALGDLESATEVLGDLELMRVECEGDCDPELEDAYASLRGALQMARAHVQGDE